jgi:hypothetical protein
MTQDYMIPNHDNMTQLIMVQNKLNIRRAGAAGGGGGRR